MGSTQCSCLAKECGDKIKEAPVQVPSSFPSKEPKFRTYRSIMPPKKSFQDEWLEAGAGGDMKAPPVLIRRFSLSPINSPPLSRCNSFTEESLKPRGTEEPESPKEALRKAQIRQSRRMSRDSRLSRISNVSDSESVLGFENSRHRRLSRDSEGDAFTHQRSQSWPADLRPRRMSRDSQASDLGVPQIVLARRASRDSNVSTASDPRGRRVSRASELGVPEYVLARRTSRDSQLSTASDSRACRGSQASRLGVPEYVLARRTSRDSHVSTATPTHSTPRGAVSPPGSQRSRQMSDVSVKTEAEEEFEDKSQALLYTSARSGDFRKLVDAIEAGANIHRENHRGMTALSMASAALKDGEECVKFLVEAKAHVDHQDHKGWTPFLHACRNGRTKIAMHLLKVGASPSTRSDDGKTAAMLALEDGADDLVMFLLKGEIEQQLDKRALDKTDERTWPILFYVCEGNHVDLLKRFLKMGPSTVITDKDGETALMVAARSSRIKIAVILVERERININTQNKDGNTAFMLSLVLENVDFAEQFFAKYAKGDDAIVDLFITNKKGKDALQICSENKFLGGLESKIRAQTKGRREKEGDR